MLPVWAIGLVAAVLVTGTVIPGLRLWWPTRTDPIRRSDLGLALTTGAMIAFAVLIVQILVESRARQEDRKRQSVAEQQNLQIAIGPTNLAGIGLARDHLDGFYLRGKDLAGANLRKAHLKQAVLVDANLQRADLTDATLPRANLSRADLRGARLHAADLERTRLPLALLDGAFLDHANLEKANLTDARGAANLQAADLQGATLDNTRLASANLIDADLREAWLVDADLSDSFLYGADLRRTKKTLRFAKLTGARYDSKTRWPGSDYDPPPCQGDACTVKGHHGLPSRVKPFRRQLAGRAPHGWSVVPRDPLGVTLKTTNDDAWFFGEATPWNVPAATCATVYEAQLELQYAGFERYASLAGLDFEGRMAVARRFGYADENRRRIRELDLYLTGKDGRCYVFRAVASAKLFPLFRTDFASLVDALGLKRAGPRDRPFARWLATS
jgi:uncharacterized protein YjbI with pentapeptide repeats